MNNIDKFIIKKLEKDELQYLEEFLYLAIFQENKNEKLDKSVIYNDDLYLYIKDFYEKKDDLALGAYVDNCLVGLIWTRIMKDYGHVDDQSPSLALSVKEEFRGFGIGRRLMEKMLEKLKEKGYKKVSLSVQKKNFARDLYLSLGFKLYKDNNEDEI